MKKTIGLLALLIVQIAVAQQSYYDDVNLNLTGEDLYDELQQKLEDHNTSFNYNDARDVLVFTDLDPDNSNDVLLVYGYNDNDGNCTTDRTRNKNSFGGGTCDYNREHVFAKSLANPSMEGSSGIIADPHNIRASDTKMNNNRGNKRFQDGSGTAGNVGSGNWYPGDEWKGDVARMVMYMYTRYDSRCTPSYVGVGGTQGTTEMLQMFLEWNAEDPVSEYEDQRNDHLEGAYGNRNPFIDNPYLATVIWGGVAAEDRWGTMSTQDITTVNVAMYPNPTTTGTVTFTTSATITNVVVYDLNGKVVQTVGSLQSNNELSVDALSKGFYLVHIETASGSLVKKLLVE